MKNDSKGVTRGNNCLRRMDTASERIGHPEMEHAVTSLCIVNRTGARFGAMVI